MNRNRPNVLMLTIDALRADRMTFHGYGRPTTPNLENFSNQAWVCERAFSLGPFTQSACIQIMTSSRPLSYGGYDAGAIGRPETIFKRFHDAGYHTTALSTLHWVNRFFGYGEGLDAEHQLFILNTLVGVAEARTRNSLSLYRAGKIPAREMLLAVEPVVTGLFDDVSEYCELRIETADTDDADFPNSLLVNSAYDYRGVKEVAQRHCEEFRTDPLAYIHRHLSRDMGAHEWLARDWYYCRKRGKILREGAFRLGNRLLARFNPVLANCRAHRFRSYVDSEALANKVIGLIDGGSGDKPFFIWAHFMDTHLPYVSGTGKSWYRQTPDYLTALGYSGDLDPALAFSDDARTRENTAAFSALYDAAIRYTDEQIGRIFHALKQKGLYDDTIIAVCGDHGEEFGEHGDIGHWFVPYEHNIHAPMMFRSPGGAHRRSDDLITLLDFAPTIAHMAGLDSPLGWEGKPVTDAAVSARDHVMVETFFGGNCIFEHRPLYFCVRTRDFKYFFKEYRDPRDKQSQEGQELYDLAADPEEQHNIYRPDHPLVPGFNRLIARRMAEIPEISRDRIEATFGPDVLSTELIEARLS